MDTGGSWQWYQNSTPTGRLEFGWQAQFELGNEHFESGVSLFKHPFTEPSSGTFRELVEDGQVDLSVRTSRSGTKSGNNQYVMGFMRKRIDNARVEAVVEPDALMIVLKEPAIIEKLMNFRPDSVTFLSITPEMSPETRRIGVKYSAELSTKNSVICFRHYFLMHHCKTVYNRKFTSI